MKNYLIPVILALPALVAAFFFLSEPGNIPILHPMPRDHILKDAPPFRFDRPVRLITASSSAAEEIERAGLQGWFEKHTGRPLLIGNGEKDHGKEQPATLLVGLLSSAPIDAITADFTLPLTDRYPEAEGYLLSVSPEQIVLAGRDRPGLFYGLLTLMQLLSSGEIPSMEIVDWPQYPMRAIYLAMDQLTSATMDIARKTVNLAASLKYNQVCVALGNGGYARLDMPVGSNRQTIGDIMRDFYAFCRSRHLLPRPEGNSRFFPPGPYPHSHRFAGDPTRLEGIRTTEKIFLPGDGGAELTIQRYDENGNRTGDPIAVRNVLHDIASGTTWPQEPLIVRSPDRNIRYIEGKDYTVQYGRIRAHWFATTHFGTGQPRGYPAEVLRWAEYDKEQEPTLLRRTAASRIPANSTVLVEFTYLGPDPYSRWKYRECLSDERLRKKERGNPLYRCLLDVFDTVDPDPAIVGLELDEYRTLGWDHRCLTSGRSRPQLWADFVKFQVDLLQEKRAGVQTVMWSDMIDRHHNGDLYGTTGAAEILARDGYAGRIIALPWHAGKADLTIPYLASLGFKLMPSCQGKSPDNDVSKWRYYLQRLPAAAAGRTMGFQYTQWRGIEGWRTILAGENGKQLGALQLVSRAAWSSGPHILLLPPLRRHNDIVIGARISGDPYHYTPAGSSGRAVVADDAGSGGRGRVTAGPCPLKRVTLIYRLHRKGEIITRPMRLDDNRMIYRASIEAGDGDEVSYRVEAEDEQQVRRTPEQGWIRVTVVSGEAPPPPLFAAQKPGPVPAR